MAVTHRQTLMNNSYNTRQEILVAQNSRGTIYAAGGQILAETATDAEGKVATGCTLMPICFHTWLAMPPTASSA